MCIVNNHNEQEQSTRRQFTYKSNVKGTADIPNQN